jgi:hypothetical protein
VQAGQVNRFIIRLVAQDLRDYLLTKDPLQGEYEAEMEKFWRIVST